MKKISFWCAILFLSFSFVPIASGCGGGDRDTDVSVQLQTPSAPPEVDVTTIDLKKFGGLKLPEVSPEQKEEIEAVERLVQKGRLQALNRKMDRAHEASARADQHLKIAKAVAFIDAAAASAVGAWAPASVAIAIGGIGIAGDGAAAAAGSLSESYLDKNKSFKQALKDASGAAIGKSIASGLLSKVKAGSKIANATIGFVGGQMYDNSSPNMEE